MNKKIFSLLRGNRLERVQKTASDHQGHTPAVPEERICSSRAWEQSGSLDFLCDCGEPVSPLSFGGMVCSGIRLTACCSVCGQRYDFRLKVDFPPDPAQQDCRDKALYKTIYRLRLKET